MVTGDNVNTARAIAGECGILTPNGRVVEGKDFRVMTKEQILEMLPSLDVSVGSVGRREGDRVLGRFCMSAY